ncbi:MAG TPA: nucleoside recognition domain-containing protein [Clostridia bacterium]|nr:nucleoside recognition domain-containing protein [Clostridia bacterium]
MMNYIWAAMMIVGLVWGIASGRAEAVASAMTEGAGEAVTLCLTLAGSYMLWMGIMNIAKSAGLIEALAKAAKKPLSRLFPDADKAVAPIALNLAANFFGAGSAATPFGLEAMREMSEASGKSDVATDGMCMFLALNSAAIELIPAGVLALRAASGSKDVFVVVLPTFVCSLISFIAAVFLMKLACRLFPYRGNRR